MNGIILKLNTSLTSSSAESGQNITYPRQYWQRQP